MPCNCTKKAGSVKFLYTSPTGKTTSYTNEIEARAAQIRQGGGTYKQVSA